MTLLDAPPAAHSDPGSAPARPRRPIRRAITVLAVLLLVAGGIVGGVAAHDANALSRVHVFLDAKPLTCTDPADVTTVTRGDDLGSDGTYAVPAVKGDLALDCTLSVVVANDSGSDIDVDRITLPSMGPGFLAGLSSDRSSTQGLTPHAAGGDAQDLVYDYADESPIGVAAGGVQRFDLHLVSDGCRQAGGTITFDDSPVVTVATGLVTVDRPREGVGFGLLGVRTTAQPCP